jgi:hypothetical protein
METEKEEKQPINQHQLETVMSQTHPLPTQGGVMASPAIDPLGAMAPTLPSSEVEVASSVTNPQDGKEITPSDEERLLEEDDDKDVEDIDRRARNLNLRDKERKRLSGAQRRRMRFLRDRRGHSTEEAKRLCLQPLPPREDHPPPSLPPPPQPHGERERRGQKQTPKGERQASNPGSKRPRSDTTTPEEAQKKRSRGQGSSNAEPNPSGVHDTKKPSYKHAVEGIRVGILPSRFPDELLSSERMEEVKNNILKQILSCETDPIRPAFWGIYQRQGFLVLICKNAATADWLKTRIESLQTWEGANLKVVDEGEIPKAKVLMAYFPGSSQDSSETILKYLQCQNEGLQATSWKILNRIDDRGTAQLVLAVDPRSAEKLQRDPCVHFKFTYVMLRLRGKQTGEDEAMEVSDPPEMPSAPPPPPAAESSPAPPAQDATLEQALEAPKDTPPAQEAPLTTGLQEQQRPPTPPPGGSGQCVWPRPPPPTSANRERSKERPLEDKGRAGDSGSRHFPIFNRKSRGEKREERLRGPSNAGGGKRKSYRPPGAWSHQRSRSYGGKDGRDNSSERRKDRDRR